MLSQTKKRVMTGGFGILASSVALGLWGVPIVLGQSAAGPQVATAKLHFEGVTAISAGVSGSGQNAGSLEFGPSLDEDTTKPQISGTIKPSRVPADHVPTPAANTIVTPNSVTGFNGISHLDQRLADEGNQFSLEPPDQGLAVGNGVVVEAVNNAITVYDKAGTILAGPMALNRFFGFPSEIVRTSTPPVFGPFLSDPRIYFDKDTKTFFAIELEIDTDPATGAFLQGTAAKTRTVIAVTKDPTGAWTVLSIDTTKDGGQFGTCPCFGDQPLMGADANGLYIATNAFSLDTENFRGAQLYAIPKAALAAGSIATVVHFNQLTEADAPFAFSIQPASAPPGGAFATGNGGTEYFVSALDLNNSLDNRLVIWALTNTASLNTATPALHLSNAVVNTEVYGAPPSAQQKPGPTPLANSLREHEELVASNDDRLQQVVFAGGKLWTALNSVVKPNNGPVRTGTAWFILSPASTSESVSATVANQGYVAANQENLLYPTIGVNAAGKGVISFTLVGPDFFPSSAFATLDAVKGAGDIQIAAAGALPDDGFSGYGGARVGRWGDYGAAVADDESGNIWMASEYIPNAPRTVNANWGTFVTQVTP
jgi:hypothetical protein